MYSKKKWIFITTVMITMLLGMTGCGKSTEDADQAESSAVIAEDLPAAEELKNGEEPEGGNAQDAPQENGGDVQADPQKNDGDADSSKEEGNKFHYINEGKDLYGDIWEVGEGQFTVTEVYVEELENGGQTMTSPAEETAGEAAKITVTYDEKTKFITQKIRDGGASHEEKEGSAADLVKGLTAEMNGSYEGDVFHATEILIVEVILD